MILSGDYAEFIARKMQHDGADGFVADELPDFLFGFQRELVAWALHQGRAAIFADCGLGKTPMQLAWANAVHRHTGRRVLVATPLAVAAQTDQEAAKFGIEAAVSRNGEPADAPLTITNYERLHHFNPSAFSGMVCDGGGARSH